MPDTKTDYSCGVVPFRVVGGEREFLLVQHRAGHWAFPKGHPEEGETSIETARRELLEETGLAAGRLLESPAFEEAYAFKKKSGAVVEKTVTYYLGQISDAAGGEQPEVVIQEQEVSAFAWGGAEATAERLTFAEGRRLFEEVLDFLETAADGFGL